MTEQPHAPRRSPNHPLPIPQAANPSDPFRCCQEVSTEEEWLGNPEQSPRTNLALEAEVHARHAVTAFENGEEDAGIAWLQSSLAFALNSRHVREFGPKVIEIGSAFTYDHEQVRP